MRNRNIVGERFGMLVVISKIENDPKYDNHYNCTCDCDLTKPPVIKSRKQLLSGKTNSCGCLRSENARALFTRHGYSETNNYSLWRSMKSRCENPKSQAFHN